VAPGSNDSAFLRSSSNCFFSSSSCPSYPTTRECDWFAVVEASDIDCKYDFEAVSIPEILAASVSAFPALSLN